MEVTARCCVVPTDGQNMADSLEKTTLYLGRGGMHTNRSYPNKDSRYQRL